MDRQRRVTGWEMEEQITRLLTGAPAGTSYCVLCVAETLRETSVERHLEVANALRRLGAYHPEHYTTFTGRCETHTGQGGTGTFWMIRKR